MAETLRLEILYMGKCQNLEMLIKPPQCLVSISGLSSLPLYCLPLVHSIAIMRISLWSTLVFAIPCWTKAAQGSHYDGSPVHSYGNTSRNAFISDLVPQMVLRGGRHAFLRDHGHEYRQQGLSLLQRVSQITQPVRQLIAFSKVHMDAGRSKLKESACQSTSIGTCGSWTANREVEKGT